eukprot:4373254-Amphidinium_carterae.1
MGLAIIGAFFSVGTGVGRVYHSSAFSCKADNEVDLPFFVFAVEEDDDCDAHTAVQSWTGIGSEESVFVLTILQSSLDCAVWASFEASLVFHEWWCSLPAVSDHYVHADLVNYLNDEFIDVDSVFHTGEPSQDRPDSVLTIPVVPMGLLGDEDLSPSSVDLTSAGVSADHDCVWCGHPPLRDCARVCQQNGCISGLCLPRVGGLPWPEFLQVLALAIVIITQLYSVCVAQNNTTTCVVHSIDNQPLTSKRMGDSVDHFAPPTKRLRLLASPDRQLFGLCGWFHDLTQDGDVEANPGPRQAQLSDYLAWATDGIADLFWAADGAADFVSVARWIAHEANHGDYCENLLAVAKAA